MKSKSLPVKSYCIRDEILVGRPNADRAGQRPGRGGSAKRPSGGGRRTCGVAEARWAGQPEISEVPVISGGCSIPSSVSIVGETSASTPPERSTNPGTVMITGTGLSE
jgi:hypothetical protein